MANGPFTEREWAAVADGMRARGIDPNPEALQEFVQSITARPEEEQRRIIDRVRAAASPRPGEWGGLRSSFSQSLLAPLAGVEALGRAAVGADPADTFFGAAQERVQQRTDPRATGLQERLGEASLGDVVRELAASPQTPALILGQVAGSLLPMGVAARIARLVVKTPALAGMISEAGVAAAGSLGDAAQDMDDPSFTKLLTLGGVQAAKTGAISLAGRRLGGGAFEELLGGASDATASAA